ncbi:DUF445 domain-containing protein [Streptomyces xinghaiensis]|uniref:DUF445 domain-containing protein n=1 Tax=Streptomyces xinghaiensis TaxID=1038928 RepID=UPI0034231308
MERKEPDESGEAGGTGRTGGTGGARGARGAREGRTGRGDGAAGRASGVTGAPGGTGTAGRTEPPGPSGSSARPGPPASPRTRGGGGLTYSAADEEKRRGVRRMKTTATGLLVLVAVVYALAEWAHSAGAGAWAGYVAAAAEAGMVGALADWFAVTALFRHPLGLPIPHTAIIPTKKDVLGRSLGDFVGENFLSSEVVRTRLRAVGISSRLGGWLTEPANAERVTAELATALRGALTVLRDSDVQAVVGEAITRRAEAREIAPSLGVMLDKVVADGGHHRVVDLVCVRAHDWLVLHNESVMTAVAGGAPNWTPRFVDRKVGERVYKELLRFFREMRDMPDHPARGAVDRFLTDFAADLRDEPDTRARVERFKNEFLNRDEVQDLIASTWNAVRRMVVAAAEDESSELRVRARTGLLSLGTRISTDARMREKVDGWLEDAAVHVVTTYRDEITSLITETIASWDAKHTTKKIEAHIGRDLQFIRINGTVVGALAGLVIYTVSRGFGA